LIVVDNNFLFVYPENQWEMLAIFHDILDMFFKVNRYQYNKENESS